MEQSLISKIEKYLETPFDADLSLRGVPATDEEIKNAEVQLNIKFHKDYIQFIKLFGGTSIGLDIYAFVNNEMMSKETVIDLTQSFRTDYEDDPRNTIINNCYVFSADDMGNPIMADKEGNIVMFYHDSDEYKTLSNSFSDFIEYVVDGNDIYSL